MGSGQRHPEVVHGYMRALDRAEQALEADLAKYLPLWKIAVPAEFESFHPWDFSKFGRGEHFVNATCRAKSSMRCSRRSSAGGSTNISRTAARRRFPAYFKEYPVLAVAPLGFTLETLTHTFRLIVSGLFDEFPTLRTHQLPAFSLCSTSNSLCSMPIMVDQAPNTTVTRSVVYETVTMYIPH